MELVPAEWPDVQTVLRQTYKIWSPGLNKSQYYFYTWRQLRQAWSRKNYRFLVYRSAGEIVGSLKLYTIQMAVRRHTFKFAGVGAVYTAESRRGLGFGKKLMEEVIALARAESYDAVYLFSDIGLDFYGRFGFENMGGGEFWIYLPDSKADASVLDVAGEKQVFDTLEQEIHPVVPEHIPVIERHHMRWLRRQPYGVERSAVYWSYKLSREKFLHDFSRWSWPRLELVGEAIDEPDGGYAIVEQGQNVLRILEVIGSEDVRRRLWGKLLSLAIFRGCTRIRGWESLAPTFLGKLSLSERSWGIPMVLPLRRELRTLSEVEPCGLLELDHL